MTATQPYSILITDDDRGSREALQDLCESQGFRAVLAADGDEAIAVVQAEPIHLAILDMHMPKLTGLETLQIVRQINSLLPAILITADATLELMRQAFNAQVFSVIPKPVNSKIVVHTMIRALVRVYGNNETESQPPSNDSGESNR